MSLKIIKAGFLDTIQDTGRFGYQSLGINPGGAMDRFAAQLANCLLGKKENAAVVEMHFPAPAILFEEATIICITGADFHATINTIAIPTNQPVAVNKNTVLHFKKLNSGARAYLSILQAFSLQPWLASYSTNLKAQCGGLEGRALKMGDVFVYPEIKAIVDFLRGKNHKLLPFKAQPAPGTATWYIGVITGNEWSWLTEESQQIFTTTPFIISTVADRMGYRLQGAELKVNKSQQLVSAAVSFGTLQLLPGGQLIMLMADHQTTGGYPRVGHVISAHLPRLAQMKPMDLFSFKLVDLAMAEQAILQQQQYLLLIQYAAAFTINKILS